MEIDVEPCMLGNRINLRVAVSRSRTEAYPKYAMTDSSGFVRGVLKHRGHTDATPNWFISTRCSIVLTNCKIAAVPVHVSIYTERLRHGT